MFDYRLRNGHATSRNAIALLEAIGSPDDVIRSARRIAAQLDEEQGA